MLFFHYTIHKISVGVSKASNYVTNLDSSSNITISNTATTLNTTSSECNMYIHTYIHTMYTYTCMIFDEPDAVAFLKQKLENILNHQLNLAFITDELWFGMFSSTVSK